MERSKWAIASLVLGILSFISLFGTEKALLAIIFGALAIKEIGKKKELTGRYFAIAGIVLGILAITVIIIVAPVLLSYMFQLQQ